MASLVVSLPALLDGLLRAAELEPVLRRCVAAAVSVSRVRADLPWRDKVVG